MIRAFALAFVLFASAAHGEPATRTGCFVGRTFLKGFALDACLRPPDRNRVMQAPVVDWARAPLALNFQSTEPPGEARVVRTCAQWFEARGHRFEPRDARDRFQVAIYERACLSASLMLAAGGRVKSYLRPDGTDLRRADQIPISILASAIEDAARDDNTTTVAILFKRGELAILDHKIGMQELKWRGNYFALNPSGRADVNRDGIDDLIVVMNVEAIEGHARKTQLAFLTRTSPDGLLTRIEPALD